MSDLIRRLQRLNYSIHSNGYKDSAIFEAIDAIQQAHHQGWEQCKAEAAEVALKSFGPRVGDRDDYWQPKIADAIATMEYEANRNES